MRIYIKPQKKIIATIALGKDYQKIWKKNIYPFWKIYCKIHNLGLVVFEEDLIEKNDIFWKKATWQRLLVGEKIKKKFPKVEDVCFLDTDDFWKKNKITHQIEYLNNNLDYSIVYSNFNILEKKKKNIRFNFLLPYGRITNQLIKFYTIGILTTCVRADIFKKYKFNGIYNVIGDFDFFLKISLKHKIGCIQKPLATYRIHKKNYSSLNLKQYILELNIWIKENEKKYKNKGFSLFFLKLYLFKLKIKYILKYLFKFYN